MPRILIPLAVSAIFVVIVAVALGGNPHTLAVEKPVVHAKPVRTLGHQKVAQPLVLPNVAAEVRKLEGVERSVVVRQINVSSNVLRFWSNHKWLLATRHVKCKEVPWQRSCTIARASQRLHTALSERATYLANRTLPYSGDWSTAVRIVQRVYPGTESWLMSCSSGEGGHGGFVMNHQGSGASGWLQFMSGTFYGHAPTAFSHVKSMGFILPNELSMSIQSPMAQAITGAYMRTHGMSSHWDPGIDPLCA